MKIVLVSTVCVALYWPGNCLTMIWMMKLMGEDQVIIIFPKASSRLMWVALCVCEDVGSIYLFIYFFKFYFIFKLNIFALVLPNIKMNLPQVYMCSPS